MLKRIISGILVLILLFSLTGCGYSVLDGYTGPWYPQIGGNNQRLGSIDTADFGTPAVAWEYDVPDNAASDSAPVVVNNKIYFTTRLGYVYCINEKNTNTIWKFQAERGATFEISPLYHDGIIYVAASDSFVYALNAETGKLIWFNTVGSNVEVYSNPVVAGENIVFGTSVGSVIAFSLKEGKRKWSYVASDSGVTRPIEEDLTYYDYGIDGGILYFGCDDTFFYALSAKTGKKLWSFNTAHFRIQTATAYNGRVYVPSGNEGTLYAFDALTGAIAWTFKTEYSVDFSGACAIKDGKLVVGAYDYIVYCMDAETGELIWKHNSWWWLQSAPTIVGNSVLIGGAAQSGETYYLYCLDFDTGNERWASQATNAVRTPAVVLNGAIFFMDTSGKMVKLS